jgi:hypothetical protein
MIRLNPVESRRYVAGQLMWFLCWVGVTVVGACLTPKPEGHGTHTELGLPPCPCVVLFGRPCPGCGLTTSFTATIHGQFGAAFHAHPLGPILYGLFTATALLALYGWWKKRSIDQTVLARRLTAAFVVIFLTFGAVRFALSPHYGDNDSYHQFALAQAR